jgi:hypothetical protein
MTLGHYWYLTLRNAPSRPIPAQQSRFDSGKLMFERQDRVCLPISVEMQQVSHNRLAWISG